MVDTGGVYEVVLMVGLSVGSMVEGINDTLCLLPVVVAMIYHRWNIVRGLPLSSFVVGSSCIHPWVNITLVVVVMVASSFSSFWLFIVDEALMDGTPSAHDGWYRRL